MIELLMVIAIMGIIVTLTISGLLAARPHAQLERGDLVVSQTLNQARNLAVSNERAVRVVFNIDDNVMVTEEADPGTEDWTEAFAPVELPDGVEFSEDGNTFPDTTVQFTPRGSLMAGGEIEILSSTGESTVFTGTLATGRFPLSGGHTR